MTLGDFIKKLFRVNPPSRHYPPFVKVGEDGQELATGDDVGTAVERAIAFVKNTIADIQGGRHDHPEDMVTACRLAHYLGARQTAAYLAWWLHENRVAGWY